MASHDRTAGSLAITAAGSLRTIAAALDVNPKTVSTWRSGAKRPSPSMQVRIEKALAIPRLAWTMAAPAQASEASAPIAGELALEATEAPGSALEGPLSALDRLREQVARLAAARAKPGLSERSYVELEKLELSASREIGRHLGRDLTDAQILGSRQWAHMQREFLEVLRMRPAAMFAVSFDGSGDDPLASVRRDFPELLAAVDAAELALLHALEARAAHRAAS
jgi:hypothetical protein